MFRFDMEINAWVPLNYKATYTQPVTVHGDSLDEFPEGAEVTPIQLTEEQAARLNAVRDDTTITLEDLKTYVLHGDDVPHKSTYDKQAAMASVIEQLPDEVIENNLDTLSDSFPPWRKNVPYKAGTHVTHYGMLYKVRQEHTSQEHQPPDAEGMLAIYLPYNPPGTIVDYDPDRNLAANPYQVGELVRFPYGVYECVRITNFSPEEHAPDWIKRDDLTEEEPLDGELLEWVQPDSTNPYMSGDKVIFEGKAYESLIDDNIWSPAAYPAGWKEIPVP